MARQPGHCSEETFNRFNHAFTDIGLNPRPIGGNGIGILEKARAATRLRVGRYDRSGEFLHRLDSLCRRGRCRTPVSVDLAPSPDYHGHGRVGHVVSARLLTKYTS